MDHLDALVDLVAVEANQFQQADLRDRKALPGARNNQRGNNGEGKRNLDLDAGALAERRLYVDRAPDALDVGLDHIHADTAAGNVRDLLCGGEASREDQVGHLSFRHAGGVVGGDQALLQRFLDNFLKVQPGPVVRDFDIDLSAFVKRTQQQNAFRILAGSAARFRMLDAMVDGIAYEVRKRIFDCLDQRFVEFSLLSFHLDAHLLAAPQRHVANRSRKAAPDASDRLHARLHDALLQFAGNQVEPLPGGDEPRVFGLFGELQDLVAGQHEFPDQVH